MGVTRVSDGFKGIPGLISEILRSFRDVLKDFRVMMNLGRDGSFQSSQVRDIEHYLTVEVEICV